MSAPEAPESVHSAVVKAHISHAVIASYVADALATVDGVGGLAGGKAVRVGTRDDIAGHVDLEIRLVLRDRAAAPDVARAVDRAVREYLQSMVAVDVGRLALVVEGTTPHGED